MTESAKSSDGFTLEDLAEIVQVRAVSNDENSYTCKLIEKGRIECAKKFGEEATEVVIAATCGERHEIIGETADLLYHLLVLLKASEVDLTDVFEELKSRTGRSGIEEKRLRNRS